MTKFVLIIVVAVISAAVANKIVSPQGQVIVVPSGPVFFPLYQGPLVHYAYVPVIPVGQGKHPSGGYRKCEATAAWNTTQTVQYCRIQCALGPAYCPTLYCRCW